MADPNNAVKENIPGDFFVDATCIDCGTCRHVSPGVFAEEDEYSYVYHQPEHEHEIRESLRALLACPTGSIGTRRKHEVLKSVRDDFPIPVTDNIFYNGFTSPKSYGASSYFLKHSEGNWLIDSPKFLPAVIRAFEAMGGIAYIFLTHSDDVGDTDAFAEYFGAKRIIHREELWSLPDAEIVIDGEAPVEFAPDFKIIPVPGHTKGSCCLLYRDVAVFTGDHCHWNPKSQQLETPQYYYWNKARMAQSQAALMTYQFDWVLPGHGMGVNLKDISQTI